jgi:hypothetical protein
MTMKLHNELDDWLFVENCGDMSRSLGMREGAALAFGIIGMAEAIRRNAPKLVERRYFCADDGKRFYCCYCPGCGAYMKNRIAGVHEGTDDEWCGACRY